MSRELGADCSLKATECDPVSVIREMTGGNGADIVFEDLSDLDGVLRALGLS